MPKVPVEMVPIAKLAPHPRNPNVGDIEAIRESIRENEWFGTVVADRRTGCILAGEHRWKAAEAEGLDAVPVYWVESRDDEHAIRIMLADNRTAQLAHYDDEALAGLLSELADLVGTGYDGPALDAILASIAEANYEPDVAHQPPLDEKPAIECPECGAMFVR